MSGLRFDGISIRSCPNDWRFCALLSYPPVNEWLLKNKVQLAYGVHWMIYDYCNRVSYVADDEMTRRCLETQTLPKVQNGGKRKTG